MKSLHNLKETAFNDTDCNDTDCHGCEHLVEDGCEGTAETCMQVIDWFDNLCDEHEGNS